MMTKTYRIDPSNPDLLRVRITVEDSRGASLMDYADTGYELAGIDPAFDLCMSRRVLDGTLRGRANISAAIPKLVAAGYEEAGCPTANTR